MLPLHCQKCGRIIGRTERETLDGKTVCRRCFNKLGGGVELQTPATKTRMIVVSAIVSAVVGGLVLFGLSHIVGRIIGQ